MPETNVEAKLPNFLIIGAAKSGTTSLYRYLSQHPQVFMSSFKEPQFFAYEGQSLDGFLGEWIPKNYKKVGINYRDPYSLDTYQQLFKDVRREIAVGEASTHYLYRPESIVNIKRHVPNVKIVVILRHPAERAFSQFLMLRASGREPLDDFHSALLAEPHRLAERWVPAFHYTQMGYYQRQLKHYYDAFGHENIFTCLHEDLISEADDLLRRLFKFLGVDDCFEPDTSKNTMYLDPDQADLAPAISGARSVHLNQLLDR